MKRKEVWQPRMLEEYTLLPKTQQQRQKLNKIGIAIIYTNRRDRDNTLLMYIPIVYHIVINTFKYLFTLT